MIPPESRYTQIGDAWIGYQVLGEGPIDLVYVSGIGSNIDTMWDYPPYAAMLERMASYARLILFDHRGVGISDPVQLDAVPTWEHWGDDLRAVLDAAGSERAAILAQSDGSTRAIMFAATDPDRTAALILWNSFAYSRVTDDYSIGRTDEEAEAMFEAITKTWGTAAIAAAITPMGDEAFRRWSPRYQRSCATPGRYVALMRQTSHLDVRSVLSSIQVPTLVLHRESNNFIPLAWGRYVAERIEGARFVVVPGTALGMYTDNEEIQPLIEDFLGVASKAIDIDRVLATVLFTDIVGSTEKASTLGDRRWKALLAEHDRTARTQVERHKGRLVNTTGDGMLATFDGPGRAIHCARTLGRALEPAGIKIRAGLHAGEIELREEGDVGGIAVHIAARVMHEAGPGEVVCSRTVKDLVAGSEFAFDDRGMCTLKGVPDEWQLYVVRTT